MCVCVEKSGAVLLSIPVTGVGRSAAFAVTPTRLDFGAVSVGGSAVHVVRVDNSSPRAVRLRISVTATDAALSSLWAVDEPFVTVPANAWREVVVRFTAPASSPNDAIISCKARLCLRRDPVSDGNYTLVRFAYVSSRFVSLYLAVRRQIGSVCTIKRNSGRHPHSGILFSVS